VIGKYCDILMFVLLIRNKFRK